MKAQNKNILIALGFSTLALVGLFSFTSSFGELHRVLQIRPEYLLALGVIYFLKWIVGGIRMQVAAKGLQKVLTFTRAMKISFYGDYFAQITPTSMGGQPAKVLMLSAGEESYGKDSAIVFMENATEIMFFLVMIPVVLVSNPLFRSMLGDVSWFSIPIVLCLIAAVIYLVVVKCHWLALALNGVLRCPPLRWFVKSEKREALVVRFEQEVKEFSASIIQYFNHSKYHLFMTMVLSTIYWSLRFALLYLVVLGFGLKIDFWFAYQIQVILFFLTLFVPVPGASGGAELIMAFLLAKVIPGGMIAAVVFGWRFFTYFLTLIIGTLGMFRNVFAFSSK